MSRLADYAIHIIEFDIKSDMLGRSVGIHNLPDPQPIAIVIRYGVMGIVGRHPHSIYRLYRC